MSSKIETRVENRGIFNKINASLDKAYKVLLVLTSVTLIPLIGIGVSVYCVSKYDSSFNAALKEKFGSPGHSFDKVDVVTICDEYNDDAALHEFCSELSDVRSLGEYSWYALIVGLSIIVGIVIFRLLFGRNRTALAFLFSPIVVVSMFLLSVSIAIQGAILCYSIYITEVTLFEIYHPKIIALIGIGAMISVIAILRNIATSFKNKYQIVNAVKISRKNGENLLDFVEDVARRVGAKSPDNIVVGLEPNFYATSAGIRLMGEEEVIKGSTLYISMPFLTIFTPEELCAVIGHELGHFKGKDTFYTMRFYPAYMRLIGALDHLRSNFDVTEYSTIFSLPAVGILSFIYDQFSKSERTIGRKREFEADKIGASLGGGKVLITALFKFSEYSEVWQPLRSYNIEWLSKNQVYENLSFIYGEVAKDQFDKMDLGVSLDKLLSAKTAHITDTHPTLNERMKNLGIDSEQIVKKDLEPSHVGVEEYISMAEEIDHKISYSEHGIMISMGYVSLPED